MRSRDGLVNADNEAEAEYWNQQAHIASGRSGPRRRSPLVAANASADGAFADRRWPGLGGSCKPGARPACSGGMAPWALPRRCRTQRLRHFLRIGAKPLFSRRSPGADPDIWMGGRMGQQAERAGAGGRFRLRCRRRDPFRCRDEQGPRNTIQK